MARGDGPITAATDVPGGTGFGGGPSTVPRMRFTKVMAGFTFHVQVFGLPMPEYQVEGRKMIESKFSTPVTYKSNFSTEGECWLTPYQVRVEVSGTERTSLFRLFVDGNLANWKVCIGNKSFVFKGVCSTSGTRELLFSIPIINIGKCFSGAKYGNPYRRRI